MNNRTRQWFKAAQRLDAHDPNLLAVCGKDRRILIFRRSKFSDMRAQYGDELEIIIEGQNIGDGKRAGSGV